jgi:hypothetical protein
MNESLATDNLNAEIARLTGQGFKVESRTERQATLSRRKPFTVWLHVLLTIVTGGLWLFVVLVLLTRKPERVTVTVDGAGRLLRA